MSNIQNVRELLIELPYIENHEFFGAFVSIR